MNTPFLHFLDSQTVLSTALIGTYDFTLVVLSVLIASIASFVALEFADRIKAAKQGLNRIGWLLPGACIFGFGAWAMHFVGMLAFSLPIPIGYDQLLTQVSVIPAIFAAAVALYILSQPQPGSRNLIVGGILMGAGVGMMHYIGMMAMRMDAIMRHDPVLFVVSVLIAVLLAIIALHIKFRLNANAASDQWKFRKVSSSIVFGLSISGMHYTAMQATYFFPSKSPLLETPAFDVTYLALQISLVTIVIFILANIVSIIASRLEMLSLLKIEITERKLTEAELTDSKARYASIIEMAGEAIISLDSDLKIVVFNAAAVKTFGYARNEILGKSINILLPENKIGGHDRLMKDYARVGPPVKYMESREEVQGRRANGTIFPMEASLFKTKTSTNTLLTVMIRDISERKKSEKALKDSEQRLRAVFDNTPLGLNLRDTEGRFLLVNKHYEEWLGKPASEIIGKTYGYFLKDWDLDKGLDETETAVLQTGIPSEQEISSTLKNGKTYDRIIIKFPIKSDKDKVTGIGTVAIDITERKKAEEATNKQLEKALEEEKAHNALQREFVSMVSHEFRTPLTIIDGTAQRISRRADKLTPEELATRISKIRDAVVRMTGLIDSTLSSGRLDAGAITMENSNINIAEILNSVCGNQSGISQRHTISLDTEELTETIWGDGKLLEQVFTNLLSNAVKYSPNSPRIEVTGRQVNGETIISFRDYGLGVPTDEIPKLFKRYFRASTALGIAGTGIGLNLVKNLVEMHGGRIEVKSAKNEGSTFTVRLPIDASSENWTI